MANQPTKYRKFVVGAASAALVASAVAPVASAAEFKDTKGNTHEDAINALVEAGIVSGYPDGSFLPNKTLTRSDVVKFMGKWLVSLGYEVPTDYKTNPRFTDQTSSTNDELLQYSALVKDHGVFNGYENGSLGAAGDITRENMAIVLVRAFDAINETDLVAFVAEQDFKKDVTDRGAAKAEARPYIDVLDYFDITNPAAPQFNPKATTTRGQFASFLYKTSKVEAEAPEEEVVTATKVESVSATNLKEVVVAFDGTVDEDTATDKANYSLKSGKAIKSVALAADGKSVTITLTGTLANNKADAVSVSNVQAGDKVVSVSNFEFTAVDNKLPEVTEVKSLGTKSVKVTFSEPVEDLRQNNFTLDGKAYFGNVVMGANNRSVILTPYSSTALAVGDHSLTVSGVKDYAGFISLNSKHDFTVVEDTVAPTITEATATLESVTITFSEDVDPSTISSSKVYWKSGDSKKTATGTPEALADNKYKFTFSTANSLPTGSVDIYVEGVKDYSGNEIAKDTKVSVTPEIDQTRPEVRKVSVNNAAATEIKVTFSKAINADSAKVLGNYTVTDSKGKVISVSDAKLDPNDSKSVIVSLYRALTNGENTIVVKNVKDATKLQNTMLDFSGKVVKADTARPTYTSAVNTADRQVVLKFNKKMDIDTLVDYSNYLVKIDGTLQTLTPAIADIAVLQDSTAVVITFAETIRDKDVKFAQSNTPASGQTNVQELTVLGLKDASGNLLKEFAENGTGSPVITNVVQLHNDTRVALTDFDSTNHAGKVAELVDTKTVEITFDTGINDALAGAFTAKVNGTVVALDNVVVDGSDVVTLKFRDALKTDADGLTIDVDYTKLVNIAGNKGVNPVVSGVVTLDQITPATNLLDSVAPTHVFAAGESEYAVAGGNTIVITYSEALQELVANNQDLIDTDFTVIRVSDNKKLNPIGEYDANVVGNTVVITLTDSRAAATAYTVTVKDAKYFADLTGNELADTSGRSKVLGVAAGAPSVAFAFDGADAGKLKGATTAHEYSLDNGATWNAVTTADQALTPAELASLTATNDIKVRAKAAGNAPAGTVKTIDIQASPAAPTVGKTDVTVAGATDGTITGVTDAMEYRLQGATTWTAVTADATTIEDLAAGTYEVRVKATGTTLAGTSAPVTVGTAS